MSKYQVTEIVEYTGKRFGYLKGQKLIITFTPENRQSDIFEYTLRKMDTDSTFPASEDDFISTNTFLEESNDIPEGQPQIGDVLRYGFRGWFKSKILAYYNNGLYKVIGVYGTQGTVDTTYLVHKDLLKISTPMLSC